MAPSDYIYRLADLRLERLMLEQPAVMLSGPRAAGKTTTARRFAKTVVQLDDELQASAFRDGPDSALASFAEPILLDEWQEVPEVLGAVKRAVDAHPRPGRFLLTGSARGRLDSPTWPGTGRIVNVQMYGLTQREIEAHTKAPGERAPRKLRRYLEYLAGEDPGSLPLPDEPPDLRGYVELALRGGFPTIVDAPSGEAARERLDGYLEHLITRDAPAVAGPRDPRSLRTYLEAVALNSAGLTDHQTLYSAASIDRKTAVAYDALLENLYVMDQVPSWSTNKLSRLVKARKRFLVDSALMGALLDLTVDAVMRNGDIRGRLIETFVLSQLRPEESLGPGLGRLYHLREQGGVREIDLISDTPFGDCVAVEIKSNGAPTVRDARHLIWLRERIGTSFVAGVVLHTGPMVYRIDDRIWALPIATIWRRPD